MISLYTIAPSLYPENMFTTFAVLSLVAFILNFTCYLVTMLNVVSTVEEERDR